MKERIEHIIKAESLSNLQFAQLLDISPASVTHLLSGRNNPSLDLIVRIARKLPHYNLRWLILGDGPIYNNGNDTNIGLRQANAPKLFPSEHKTTEEATRLSAQNNQITTESNNHSPSANRENTPAQQTLIVCLPDGTYREYTKQ